MAGENTKKIILRLKPRCLDKTQFDLYGEDIVAIVKKVLATYPNTI